MKLRILLKWLAVTVMVMAVVGGSLALPSMASAEEYYVHADAAPAGDGESWATAFDSLDDITPFTTPALEAGDTIYVAGGTINAYPALVTAYSGVRLIGGFPPTGNPSEGFQNPGLYPSIIDASASNVGLVVVDDADQSTIIDGFVIENADIYGIQNGNTSRAVFTNLVLRGNGLSGSSGGGAFANGINYALPRVTNCLFENNFSGTTGGALNNPQNSSFRIEGCVFRNNQSYIGGAISNAGRQIPTGCQPEPCDSQPIPIVRFSVFEDNEAILRPDPFFDFGFGGAIYDNGDIKILACKFTDNYAEGDDEGANGGGGAIYSVAGRIIIQDTEFMQNHTEGDGGAINVFRGCELSADSCLFARNEAIRHGGAIRATELNQLILQNCTITENDASQWAGVYARVDVDACGPSTPFVANIENNILWKNGCLADIGDCTDDLEQLDVAVGSGGTLVVDYNDISAPAATFPGHFGAHNLDILSDPQFIDPDNRNYRLQVTSPCIDAANGEVIPQDSEDADADSRTMCNGCDIEDSGEHVPDLDLARRFVDVVGVDNGGLVALDDCPLECNIKPDMGAHERIACIDSEDCATPGDLNGDTVVNGLDIQPFTWCAVYQSQAELPCLCADFSGPTGTPDSVVNAYDIPCFIELLLTGENGCVGPIICGEELFTLQDCNENEIPDANDIAFGTSLDCNKNGIPDECDLAAETSDDVNSNDIPDECEVDCNGNDIPDAWDISEETSNDVNSNDIPDECEPDCNDNDVPDAWDVSEKTSDDCNENGIPDECDDDCNDNDVPDDCDIADETSVDCNENGVPDECDLARFMLPSFDCNDNDVPDECDIANETSADENENGIPDECEEEFLMGGGGQSMMGGEGGGEFDAEAAWAEFYEWFDEQVFGDPGDWHTLTGPERFERVMAKIQSLGLPYATPW